ncbi:hypothetical protein SY88_10745 [Clostridiales bacterium PH28_bin88]|nr:hypothetical protein SY88_10745 [Clostridiales bacterium PH28_bin88]
MQRPLVMAVVAFIFGIILAQRVNLSLGLVALLAVMFLLAVVAGYRRGWRFTTWLILGCFLAVGLFWATMAVERNRSALGDWLQTHLVLTGVVAEEPQVYANRVAYTLRAQEVRQESRYRELNEKVQVVVYAPRTFSQKGAGGRQERGSEDLSGERRPLPGGDGDRELTPWGAPLYRYGDVLQVQGQLELPSTRRNPGEFDYRSYLARRGIFTRMQVDNPGSLQRVGRRLGNPVVAVSLAAKSRVVALVDRALPAEQAGVLLALLFGDKERLEKGEVERFRALGVMHVFAVSGLHVGFLLFFMMEVAGLARLSKRATGALVLAGLVFYAGATGFTASVVRAALMAALGIGAYLWDRDRDFYTALALAAMVLLLVNPFALFDTGFQLSFVATWGLVYLYPLLGGLLAFLPAWRRYLVVPLAAQVALLPLTAYYFNQISLAALAANLSIVPVVGVVVVLGLVVVMLVIFLPPVAAILVQGVGAIVQVLLAGTQFMADFPGIALPVRTPHPWETLSYYTFLVIAREVWQRRSDPWWQTFFQRRRYLLAGVAAAWIMALSLVPYMGQRDILQVTFLDVGQGSAVYIRTPGGRDLLVDGGGRPVTGGSGFDVGEDIVVPYLIRRGVKKLDVVLSSHPDTDHLQGLFAVLRQIPATMVVTPPPEYFNGGYQEFLDLASLRRARHVVARRGNTITLGREAVLEVLAPAVDFSGTRSDDNNGSLVVKLTYRGTSFLLTGDVELEGMEDMLELGHGLQSTVLAVPHHGSRYGLHGEFLAAVAPSAAVIQVGEGNSFGHPAPDIIRYWEERGVPVYRTDSHGAITFWSDGQKWWAETVIRE